MEFASVALRILLPKLAKLLQDEYHLQSTGATREGMRFLYEELERTQAALSDVGEVPPEQLSDLVRLWARDLRDVSYDMEDIIDTFVVRVQGAAPRPGKKGVKRFMKKLANLFTAAKNRRDVAKEIEDITHRVKEVTDRRDRYKLDTAITPAKKTLPDPRITALFTKVTELVGIDEEKEHVITRLTKGDASDLQEKIVVSIAGFGGLGKTTLARAVCDEIQEQFDCTAFISVSRNPEAKKLLKDMLYELDKENFKDGIHSTILDETQLVPCS